MKLLPILAFSLAILPLRGADRPNILIIVSEDNGPELGCYGDPYARTPNLDRLASQGDVDQRLFSKRFTFATLSDYQCQLFNQFVHRELPSGIELAATLNGSAELRAKTRLAEALLFRNESGDSEQAVAILRWVLKYQCQDEASQYYGVWKKSPSGDWHDPNWREFVGCDLIIILHAYRSTLPTDLVNSIETALIHAARGALKRDVAEGYSNISVMSAFLMEYTGTAFKLDSLKHAGLRKAREIVALYRTYSTFNEFNSPTYYGVTLIGLALWREMAYSEEMKAFGKTLEHELWREVATFYNANLKNFPAPYFRSYGMDMQKYNSIIGLWIAVAADDEALAPFPGITAAKGYEMSNIATILHLGLSLSQIDLKQLKDFGSARYIKQRVARTSRADSEKDVTVMVNKDWMMGGVWGSRRAWGQIKTAAIHWKTAAGEVSWVLVPGDGTTNVRVTETNMNIYLADQTASVVEVYLYSANLATNQFHDHQWVLPGMTFQIKTDLNPSFTGSVEPLAFSKKWFVSEQYPEIFRVTYPIATGWNLETPLLEITPHKTLR
jgi:hypothetical protein